MKFNSRKTRVYFNSLQKAESFAKRTKSRVEVLADSKEGIERSIKHRAKYAVQPQTKKKEMWDIEDNQYCNFGEGYTGKESNIIFQTK